MNLNISTIILSAITVLAFSSNGGAGGAGTVTGRALDAKGNPIANAKIWVKPVVTTGLYSTRTDATGRYEATGLPPVGYRVMGWFEKEYDGKQYCLRLGQQNTTDYNPLNPANGATRDLLWRTSGRIEDMELYSDSGYFGGSVSVMSENYIPARNTTLEFTLTPTGKLIDGSSGKVLTRKPNAEGYILDVPVGVYKATATMLENGTKKTVRLGNTTAHLGSQATLEFPGAKQSCVGTSASGVERAYLYWGKGTTSSNTVPSNPVQTIQNSSQTSMSGTWDGNILVKGGSSYNVRYEFIDLEQSDGFISLGGDFFECTNHNDCEKIGTVTAGKLVPSALVNFTTTLEKTGASFETVGHFEPNGSFKGLTDAVFEGGKQATLNLNRH